MKTICVRRRVLFFYGRFFDNKNDYEIVFRILSTNIIVPPILTRQYNGRTDTIEYTRFTYVFDNTFFTKQYLSLT